MHHDRRLDFRSWLVLRPHRHLAGGRYRGCEKNERTYYLLHCYPPLKFPTKIV
jgi:hypothetical protein